MKSFIGVSISTVVCLILGSFSTVIAYQSVQSSYQQTIQEEVSQQTDLFQIFVDIVNNKEIQRSILKAQMMNGRFLDPETKLSIGVTKNRLKQMYFIGMMLSKLISKSRLYSLLEQYRFRNDGLQKELYTVIEKDAILQGEMHQLSISECGCDTDQTSRGNTSVICFITGAIFVVFILLMNGMNIFGPIALALITIILAVDLVVWLAFDCMNSF